MREQLQSLGISFDWDREVTTCDPSYYRWTQWLFLQLYREGWAYQADATVNWDPVDGTVLANEQVDPAGRSWRSGAVVERRKLRQWFFRISGMANELEDSLEGLSAWPDRVKTLQRNWIGRSQGTQFTFKLAHAAHAAPEAAEAGAGAATGVEAPRPCPATLDVFTTRADTLFGASFVALAHDHPVVDWAVQQAQTGSDTSLATFARNCELARLAAGSTGADDEAPRGVRLHVDAVHPVTGARLPVYVASYVVAEYGAGAVMGVPAHDERDLRFARAHDLPVQRVIAPPASPAGRGMPVVPSGLSTGAGDDGASLAFTGDGVLINSGPFTGMSTSDAIAAIAQQAADEGVRSLPRPALLYPNGVASCQLLTRRGLSGLLCALPFSLFGGGPALPPLAPPPFVSLLRSGAGPARSGACATGWCRGSATGAPPSPLCTALTVGRCRCRKTSCP